MDKFFVVGFGGGLGAVSRYCISLLPSNTIFPVLTLLINLVGAVIIGIITGLGVGSDLNERWLLFWRVGVCGGFTTFSTFSFEAWNLIEGGKPMLGAVYILLSVVLCIFGVVIGKYIGTQISIA